MIPHFAVPFRIVAGAAAVNEQDSLDDVVACSAAVLLYTKVTLADGTQVGPCPELPAFGTPDQALRQNGADLAEITAALDTWEPRATETLAADTITDLVQTVHIQIGAQGD